MADVISGGHGGAQFAPLSQAQTAAMGRHLQEQIKTMQGQLDDLTGELRVTNDFLSGVKDTVDGNCNDVNALQDGLSSAKSTMESNRMWINKTNESFHRLRCDLDQSNQVIGSLRDAEQLAARTMKKFENELAEATEVSNKLQVGEHKADLALRQLTEELARTNLAISHLKADGDGLKVGLHDVKEMISDTNKTTKTIQDDLAETTNIVQIVERRLQETAQKLRNTKQELDESIGQTLALHEDHENTKALMAEMHNTVRKMTYHIKQTHEFVEKTSASLANTQSKLGDQTGLASQMREGLDDAQSKIQELTQNGQRVAGNMQKLQQDLAAVTATTLAVRAGLKEQSSLLLPNINMDSQEAKTASARHGSLLMPSNMGSLGRTR